MVQTIPMAQWKPPMKQFGMIGGLGAALVALIVLMILTGSWYTIDQTQRGVLLRNGAFVEVVQPGLHFKWPLIDNVVKIDMQTHTYSWAKVNSYSADQQPADLKVSITIRTSPDKVPEVYSRFAGDLKAAVERLVTPLMNKDVKIVFGQYTAVRAITQRGPLNADVMRALTDSMAYDPIFIVEGVQIENIDFSPDYIKSVEARMQAEVEVQRLRQNLERERVQAEIVVTQAKAQADRVRLEAQANADAIKLRGNAEAEAIDARGKALAGNPALVNLVQAEKWDGKLPATMIPGGAIPMLNLTNQAAAR
jgi:regulator of protease activity HflC (stomatin/prohibitin superfamily)